MDWDKLRTFNAAAETGSLTAAAELLGMSQSALSRQIAALEQHLGVALFHRHARGLQPTEQGRLLFETTHNMAARVHLAEAALQDSRDKPSGDLHITAPVALGTAWLTPRLKSFIEAYPDIRIQLILDDAEVDLSTFEVEAAIRLWRPTQPDLIQRKLSTVRQQLYASAEYLRRNPTPETEGDLDNHPLISYRAGAAADMTRSLDWVLRAGAQGPARSPALVVNTVLGVKSAVEAGIGIGSLPEYLARDSRTLARVLTDLEGPEMDVYLVYPEELRGNRRVGAFRDFVVRAARKSDR